MSDGLTTIVADKDETNQRIAPRQNSRDPSSWDGTPPFVISRYSYLIKCNVKIFVAESEGCALLLSFLNRQIFDDKNIGSINAP